MFCALDPCFEVPNLCLTLQLQPTLFYAIGFVLEVTLISLVITFLDSDPTTSARHSIRTVSVPWFLLMAARITSVPTIVGLSPDLHSPYHRYTEY